MKRVQRRQIPVLAISILLACCSCVFALDPSLDVNQYAHTAWKVSEGYFKSGIWSVAQTPDGYLWLGTEFGLLRFDGVRAVPWQPSTGDQLPSSDVRSLRVGRDGSLWIGTYRGLASWKNGKLTHYPELDGLIVEWLLEDREGTFWAVAGWTLSEARLCSIQGGQTHCYGENGGPGSGVTAIYEDSKGNLWAGAMSGVWRWEPGPPKLYPMPDSPQRTYGLIESDDGGILIARRDGLTKLLNGKLEVYAFPGGLQFHPNRLLRDRDGGLWVGALGDGGLLHIHQGKADRFTPAFGISGDLSGDSIRSFLEDQEGNIWVSTGDGLDRFREFAVPTLSVQQGLSSRSVLSVLAARNGSVWLGTSGGLNRWNKGQITIYRKPGLHGVRGSSPLDERTAQQAAEPGTSISEIFLSGLPQDEVTSLFEDNDRNVWVSTTSAFGFLKDERFIPVISVPPGNVLAITGDRAGNIWVSHDDGLFLLHQARLVDRIPWSKLGHREPARALLHDPVQDGLWIGFREGGVALFRDGQIRASYTAAQGLSEGIVHNFYRDPNGALWVATEGGLSRIKDDRVLTLTTQNGLPCNNVHWMMEDDLNSVWLYTACGLVRIGRPELDAWTSDPKQTIRTTVFDSTDGVRNHGSISGYSPIVAKSTDGKLWFVGSDGVSVLDPHHLAFNKFPPPVHIEQVTADGITYGPSNGLRLPAGVRDLMFDFTGLTFVAPEKVRLRVMLEGQDKDWRELISQRRVHYTNLSPRTYRFRVVACNNSGVCNDKGDVLEFSVAPAFYQRASFRVLSVIAFLALLFAAFRLRVRQLTRQFNKTLEARVSERTRIARELHDTMLQSFQGLLLRFQSVVNVLPPNADEAKQRLDLAVDQAAAAITEGRNAVQGLRSSAFETNDLAAGIIAIGQELTSDESAAAPAIDVEVEGASRNLNPVVRDEAYRIAGEALRNAVRHAEARRITVEIHYERRRLRLRVRDDGKGIDEATLRSGHAGHFGLPGMRERAETVRGRLEVWSKRDTGTEIELRVPGTVAYAVQTERSWFSKVFSGT